MHAIRNVDVLAGVVRDLIDGHLIHRDLIAAGTNQLGDLRSLVLKVAAGEIIEAVIALAGIDQVVGNHGVEDHATDFDALLTEHDEIVFDVLADLGNRRVAKNCLEGVSHRFDGQCCAILGSAKRNVGGFADFPTERKSDGLSPTRIGRSGFSVQRNQLGGPQLTH